MSKEGLIQLVDIDFPDLGPITEKIRQNAQYESQRYRGGVRLSTGRFWTDEEYEKYRKKVLSKSIP